MSSMNMMGVLIVGWGLVPAAWAQPPESGAYVTQSQGVEVLAPGPRQEQTVAALSRVAPGTRLRLGEGGRLQLIYLREGRQEVWQDKAVIEVGEAQSQALAVRYPPQVKKLPAYLVEALAGSSVVAAGPQPRRAMIRVRSLGNAAQVKTAQARYAELRAEADEADITPELYLIGALEGLKAYAELRGVLDELERKQPESPAVKGLRQRYQALLEGAGTGLSPAPK